jgi:hypothetical protein
MNTLHPTPPLLVAEIFPDAPESEASRSSWSDARDRHRATAAEIVMLEELGWRRIALSTERRLRMAIGIRVKLPGVTQEQFDQVHDHINPDRTPPKGLIFHASGPIDGGWGIIDFWESREDFDAFSVRIAEGMAGAGVQPQGPPDIKEFPVHETILA